MTLLGSLSFLQLQVHKFNLEQDPLLQGGDGGGVLALGGGAGHCFCLIYISNLCSFSFILSSQTFLREYQKYKSH